MPHGDHQEEPATRPENADEKLNELERESKKEEITFVNHVQKTADEVGVAVQSLELDTFHSEVLDKAQDKVLVDPGQAIADAEDQQKVIDELRKKLETVSMKLAQAPSSAKQYNLQRFLVVWGILTPAIAAAALIYTAIHAAQNNQPAPAPLPPDVDAKIRALVREWNTESDEKYWDDLAAYVDLPAQDPPLTLGDQVLFMNYTIGLAPGGEAWVWQSADDVVQMVKQLVDVYNSTQKTSKMYQAAAKLRYHSSPLPRAVTATLLRHALCQLIVFGLSTGPVRSPLPGGGLGGEGDGDDRLSEVPDNEADKLSEDAAEAREEEEFAKENAATAASILQDVESLSVSTVNCDSVEDAWVMVTDVANSAIADPAPDARLTELDRKLSRLIDAASGTSDTKAKQYNVSRYVSAVFGVVALAGVAVFLVEYLTRRAQGKPVDDLPALPPDTQSQIHDLVVAWRSQSDTDYWGNLAGYVEKNADAMTPADQVYFLNYTVELCPPATPFLWDSAGDKAAITDQLVATAGGSKAGLPAMYRSLPTVRYQGAPLPRAVAADVARLAVAWIAHLALPPQAPPPQRTVLGDPGRAVLPGSDSGIPPRLRPRIHVTAVAGGTDPVAYARQLNALLRPPGVTSPAALAAAAAYRQPSVSPYRTFDYQQQIATYPPHIRQQLQGLVEQLGAMVAAVFPLPDGERVESSTVTCLAEDAGELPAGTVVYVRQTDRATVQFVLEHIVIDLATGRPSLRGLDGPASTTVAPPRPVQSGLGEDAASIALSVAGNLAWVMPPPWGPIVSAGFTLVQLLMSQGNPSDQFSAVVRELEAFLQQHDVNNDATHIKGLADWLQAQVEVLSITQVDNSEYITSTLLPELRKMVAPGDESVYNAVYDLENNLGVPGALKILTLGVTVYLLSLKMIVQLDAQLASTRQAAGDDAGFAEYTSLWLADYAAFSTAINGYTEQGVTTPGWVVRMAQHVDSAIDARLSQITEPYRYNNAQWVVVTGGGSTGTSGYWVDDWGWTYRDLTAGDSDTTNFVADTFSGGDCCHGQDRNQHQDDVQRNRDAHVAAVTADLDTQYGDITATAKKWLASIQEWSQHLPPRPPTTAPVISGWNGTVPQGGWVRDAAVSYAVAFVNEAGPSQLGAWSPWTPITDKAFPTLTELPTDPLGMATNRWIYRRFRNPDQSLGPIRIVGITDVTATSYDDKKD